MAASGEVSGVASDAIRDLVARAMECAPELGREVWAQVRASIPEASSWDPSLLEAGPPAAEAIIRELAANLVTVGPGDPMHSVALGLAHARQFAREEVPLTALLRVYQLGHHVWRDFYVAELGRSAGTATELVESAGVVSSLTFAFLDTAAEEVTEAYDDERVRARESGQRARRRTLDGLLAGDAPDLDAAGLRLGIDLRQAHTALVATAVRHDGEDPVPGLERVLRDLARAVGVERPLVVAPGWTTAYAWLTRRPAPGAVPLHRRIAEVELPAGDVEVTCGAELGGAEGFRASHREALAARPFARPGAPLVYEEVELASLLCADPERARSFARRELGRLAVPDDATARLRETLSVYLASSSSATRTAERMGIHKNTVVYRVRQAEVARGDGIQHHRLELEAALRLARAMPELLSPTPP